MKPSHAIIGHTSSFDIITASLVSKVANNDLDIIILDTRRPSEIFNITKEILRLVIKETTPSGYILEEQAYSGSLSKRRLWPRDRLLVKSRRVNTRGFPSRTEYRIGRR